MTEVYLGLGSNLGDREANLRRALESLREVDIKIPRVSPIYETEPVDTSGPAFLNMACCIETSLEPLALLETVKGIEVALGRTAGPRNAPRPIDIDILLYGDLALETRELTIPHPRMAQRAFVLIPLANISPEVVVLGLGKGVRELLEAVQGREGVWRWSQPP